MTVNMMLVAAWSLLGLCVLPLIGASLLAAVSVAVNEPREYH